MYDIVADVNNYKVRFLIATLLMYKAAAPASFQSLVVVREKTLQAGGNPAAVMLQTCFCDNASSRLGHQFLLASAGLHILPPCSCAHFPLCFSI
jgi:hypothetical protein